MEINEENRILAVALYNKLGLSIEKDSLRIVLNEHKPCHVSWELCKDGLISADEFEQLIVLDTLAFGEDTTTGWCLFLNPSLLESAVGTLIEKAHKIVMAVKWNTFNRVPLNETDRQYHDLMRLIDEIGAVKADRTGTGTKSIFGHQMRFNLAHGFPLLTTKKVHLKSIIHELLWFLQGETNIRYLKENGVSIWDEWIKEGTAEYRQMTLAGVSVALLKRFAGNGATAITGVSVVASTPVDFDFRVVDGGLELLISKAVADEMVVVGDDKATHLNTLTACAEFYGINTKVLVAGELGPVYGSQWRSWPNISMVNNEVTSLNKEVWDEVYHAEDQNTYVIYKESIDQISNLIEQLRNNPDSRRLIVSAWNPAEVDEMALPPCHCLFQFYTAPLSGTERWRLMGKKGTHISFCTEPSEEELHRIADEHGIPSRRLSCQLYQRSADVFLGVPFNIASYALLVMMIAQVTNMVPGDFIWTGGDCHLYSNHKEQVELQLSREGFDMPTMRINPDVKDLFAFQFSDFTLENYQSHPVISAPIAV